MTTCHSNVTNCKRVLITITSITITCHINVTDRREYWLQTSVSWLLAAKDAQPAVWSHFTDHYDSMQFWSERNTPICIKMQKELKSLSDREALCTVLLSLSASCVGGGLLTWHSNVKYATANSRTIPALTCSSLKNVVTGCELFPARCCSIFVSSNLARKTASSLSHKEENMYENHSSWKVQPLLRQNWAKLPWLSKTESRPSQRDKTNTPGIFFKVRETRYFFFASAELSKTTHPITL